jgi:hypothetical protein
MNWLRGILNKPGILGEIFNRYCSAINAVSAPATEHIDVNVVVRIRLYGDQAQKQAAFDELAKANGAVWGRVQWSTVSTTPPQMFGDLRLCAGQLIINHLALGHELCHVLRLVDDRILDPDAYALIEE